MTKSLSYQFFAALGVLAIMAMVAIIIINSAASTAEGSTLAYAVPHVATSSVITVGPQSIVTINAASSNCTARVIGTLSQPIMLSFTSLIAPSASVGHFQATSTSAVYNNGDYGCGIITGYAAASTSVTITQFTQ